MVSFITPASLRDSEHTLDIAGLAAGLEYTVSFHDHGIAWWRYGTKEELVQQPLPPTEAGSPEVHACNMPTFHTLADAPPPPKVTVRLSASSSTCCLSGHPPFTIDIQFVWHASEPITVLTNNTLILDSGIDIIDAVSGKRVGPDQFEICDEGPWEAEDFMRPQPGVPYVQSRTLSPTGGAPDLPLLTSGREYIVRYQDLEWWWGYDEIDEMRAYAGDRSNIRPPRVTSIRPVPENEVKFRAE